MTRATPSCRRAFTLIEVLAALATVAIVLPVAMAGISLAVNLGADARRRSEAVALAQSKLEELAVTGAWQTGELSGDFGQEWPAYRWSASVQAWNSSSVNELDVEVSWTSRQKERSLLLSTLVQGGGI